jgi:hypothetical protein
MVSEKKNILIINKTYEDNLSIGIRHKYLIEYLNSINNVFMLKNNKREIPLMYKLFFKIYYKFLQAPESSSVNNKALKKEVIEIIKENRINTVVILVKPFYFLRLTKFLKSNYPNIYIIVDLSDPFYENISLLNSNFYYKYLIKLFEKKYFTKIDKLISTGEDVKEYYKKYVKESIVIEQGVNNVLIENTKKDNNENIRNDIIRIIYGGKFYKKIREPFELYKAVLNCNKKVKLTIYTQLDDEYFLPPQNEKIEYKNAISQENLFEEFHKSNIIIFIDNFYGVQIPGKTIELLAFSKPILFIFENDNSPSMLYLKEHQGVFFVKNDQKLIKSMIENIINRNIFCYKRDISQYYWTNIFNKVYE